MEDSTHIDSTKISLYIQQLEFTVSNLEATITRMKKECFDPKKFYGTAITVDACARMHNVCVETVREYVHGGSILRSINVDNLKQNGIIYFLDRSLEQLIPTTSRPLSSTKEALKQKYKELKLSI